jgi:hypothetical protein
LRKVTTLCGIGLLPDHIFFDQLYEKSKSLKWAQLTNTIRFELKGIINVRPHYWAQFGALLEECKKLAKYLNDQHFLRGG